MSLHVDPGLRTEAEPVSEEDAEAYVASVCFKTGPPHAVGVEVERLVQWRDNPRRRLAVPRIRAILDPLFQGLPAGGNLSLEPGDNKSRLVKFEFQMTAETYIPQPIVRKKAVLKTRTEILDGLTDQDALSVISRLEEAVKELE